ncbi:hypothetical protein [Pseudomonas aeruginosa]|uniref:hypothetical protein n=1 Tax=Pseudomonas aeruginosa TaxID=287 RepID=UPI001CC0AC57|nr:hypothetical protein [Pseudomonas aeruginosa]
MNTHERLLRAVQALPRDLIPSLHDLVAWYHSGCPDGSPFNTSRRICGNVYQHLICKRGVSPERACDLEDCLYSLYEAFLDVDLSDEGFPFDDEATIYKNHYDNPLRMAFLKCLSEVL